MEYDKRIIDPTKSIWTPFGATSDNNIYVGMAGYFTDAIGMFSDLNKCRYGTLEKIDWDSIYPFYTRVTPDSSPIHYALFLPERDVKRKEKKWNFRPFNNTKEFFDKTGFEVGDVIHIRDKDDNVEYHLMLVGWAECTLMLGVSRLNLKELFKWFELWDGENKFIPFGVEEP